MTDKQAKEILRLYRPGTADADDPAFAEALALCERDAQLKEWFAEHCALYSALRSKFRQISVPEGLKEQIIAERPVRRTTPVWQKATLLAGAVAVIVMIVSALTQWHSTPRERHDFAAYRTHMISYAERGYGMDLLTNDLNQIHSYLVQRGDAITNYVVPDNLQKNAKVIGCAAQTWQDNKVSMLCFATGRPMAQGQQSDLWLFVTDRAAASDTPTSATPAVEKLNDAGGHVAASWTVGNRTYVLATKGDEEFLKKFL